MGKNSSVVHVWGPHVTGSSSFLTLLPLRGKTIKLAAAQKMEPPGDSNTAVWGTSNTKDSTVPALDAGSWAHHCGTIKPKEKAELGVPGAPCWAESSTGGKRMWSIPQCERVRGALRTELYTASSLHPFRTLPGLQINMRQKQNKNHQRIEEF